MSLPGYPSNESFLRRAALDALVEVGDRNVGQWEEWSGRAYHVRRRLTRKEQQEVGDALDIRGTSEAKVRHEKVRRFLPESVRFNDETVV
jgi:hypothetical protein